MNKTLINILEFFGVLSILFLAISFLSHLIMRRVSMHKWLCKIQAKSRGSGYVLASIFGAVTPFCVCTTIPIFTGMVQMGIRASIAISFLLSSPLINISSIFLIFFLFGAKFSLYFAVTTLIFSTIGGLLAYHLKLENEVNLKMPDSCFAVSNMSSSYKEAANFSASLFKSLLIPLAMGAIVAGLIHNYIPVKLIGYFNNFPLWVAIPLMALIGFPLYLNILALTPICISLVNKGMNPAVVMTFMMSGAGISLPTAIVLAKVLKRNLFVYYLLYTFIGYCLIGFIFNML